MTHFIFDCDDVLLDWEAGFIAFIERMTSIKLDTNGPQTWCLAEWIGNGCTTDEAKAWVIEFNNSDDFGKLTTRPGARELIWDLRNAGHTISVLTACGGTSAVKRARVDNLDREFAQRTGSVIWRPHEQTKMLPLGASKLAYLYEFTRNHNPRDTVFVEDNFEHAKSGVACGIRSYCLRRSHNRQQEANNPDTKVIWIDDLDAIRLDFIPSIQPNVDKTTGSES